MAIMRSILTLSQRPHDRYLMVDSKIIYKNGKIATKRKKMQVFFDIKVEGF